MKLKISKKGFTLVELVIVIAVLAIIAAIAIPSVTGVIKNANRTADESNLQALDATIKTFQAELEANSTHTMSADKLKLKASSTLNDMLKCYGMTFPTMKSGISKIYWDINGNHVTVTKPSTAGGYITIDSNTQLFAMKIIM